jgi:phosphoribosyl 1,2-cyclic phosphodiesterase
MTLYDASISSPSISARFWGVRGSVPCPGPETVRYGGNTACVEIRCGSHILVFDAGTGIRPLGRALANTPQRADLDIFLSHCHMDHIIGLPYFAPLFVKDQVVRVWAGNLKEKCGVKKAIGKMMDFPLLPLQTNDLPAQVEFRDFCSGETISPRPGITLHTAPLNHPGGATGYRIDYNGRSIAYLTDIDLGDGPIDPAILALVRNVELVIFDATFTDDELPSHAGWGHSSWQQGVRLASAAGANRLCLFHHDPDHSDAFMDCIASAAAAARPGTIVAHEGLQVDL